MDGLAHFVGPPPPSLTHAELSRRVYVGNLAFSTDAESLGLAFSHVGAIGDVVRLSRRAEFDGRTAAHP